MKHLLLAAGAALALGNRRLGRRAGRGHVHPVLRRRHHRLPDPGARPLPRVDLQPGDCGAAGLDCGLTQFGPFRRSLTASGPAPRRGTTRTPVLPVRARAFYGRPRRRPT